MLTMPNKIQQGFTLVELMVGLVIIAILFSAGAPSFMSWIQNTQIRTAAETTSGGLQLARAEAVRRNTSIQFTLTGADSSWTVGCATATATCPAVIQSKTGAEGTSNVSVTVDNASVTFNGLGRASNSMTINLTNPTGGNCQAANGVMRCLDVRVTTGGQVRMCNPSLPNTNPQGC